MIKDRNELTQMRKGYETALNKQRVKILICAGTGCVAGGSLEIYARLKTLMEEQHIPCTVALEKEPHDESVGLKKSGCHGFCEKGPLVKIEPWGYLYIKVKVEKLNLPMKIVTYY